MDFVLRADVGNAVRGLIEVIEKQKMSGEEMKKFGREGKSAGITIEGALKGVGNLLGVGGGIATGIFFLRQQVQGWSEDTKKLAEKFANVNKELVLAISKSGDLANLAEIQDRLKGIYMPGLGPAERVSVYRAMRGNLPMESAETIMKLLPEAGKAKIFEKPEEFAARMGTTYQLYRGKLTPGDLADTAKIVGDLLGANVEKYGTQVFREAMQLQAVGMDTDKALAMVIAAAEQGQLRSFGGLRGVLTEERIFEPGRRLTPKERIQREFFKISDPMERLRWLMAEQGKGGKAAAVLPDQGVLAAISQVNIGQMAENIRRAREQDYFEMTRRLALGTQPGAMLLKGEEAKAFEEKAETEAGREFARTDIARRMLSAAGTRYTAAGYPFAPWVRTFNRALLETSMMFGMGPERALKETPLGAPGAGWLRPWETRKAFSEETISGKDIQELTKAIKDLTKIEHNKTNIPVVINSGMVD